MYYDVTVHLQFDVYVFFFKQKPAYEIYQCDWSSDVCSSDLMGEILVVELGDDMKMRGHQAVDRDVRHRPQVAADAFDEEDIVSMSEEDPPSIVAPIVDMVHLTRLEG